MAESSRRKANDDRLLDVVQIDGLVSHTIRTFMTEKSYYNQYAMKLHGICNWKND